MRTAMHRHAPPSRLPAFLPVPARARSDGWTPLRQAEFIGWLAETGSVRAAAARDGMARETAYRLRRRAGAEGFAAAWDAALGTASSGRNEGARKVTRSELERRAFEGMLRPLMRAGPYCGTHWKPDDSALLRLSGEEWRTDLAAALKPAHDANENARKGQPAAASPRSSRP